MLKKVKSLIGSQTIDMDGILVQQVLPSKPFEHLDPFLLLHHHHSFVQSHTNPFQSGIGPHPHRGFSPITFVLQGAVHHRDSRGNSSVVEKGGVQWMHAGMGIIHSERPSAQLAENGGVLEIIQVWINSPANKKMAVPAYVALHAHEIPTWNENGTIIKLIAGNFKDQTANVPNHSPLFILEIELVPHQPLNIDIPADYETALYVASGSLSATHFGLITDHQMAIYNLEGEDIEITATNKCKCFLFSGLPILEPIVQQGPFVCNSTTEIMFAMRDYQMGKMGMLFENEM